MRLGRRTPTPLLALTLPATGAIAARGLCGRLGTREVSRKAAVPG